MAPELDVAPCPVSEPARFAISLCMQCGNVLPAPTTNELPQPLAPSAKFICSWANDRNAFEPPYRWYSALVTARPNACGVASLWPRADAEAERVARRLALPQPQLARPCRSAARAAR